MGYFIVLFFINYALATFFNKELRYLFIRLLVFLISLVLIPQIFLLNQISIEYIDPLSEWGSISNILYNFSGDVYVSSSLSLIGSFLFLSSQNLLTFIRLPKIRLSPKRPSFKMDKNKIPQRKEPIIKNSLKNNKSISTRF